MDYPVKECLKKNKRIVFNYKKIHSVEPISSLTAEVKEGIGNVIVKI